MNISSSGMNQNDTMWWNKIDLAFQIILYHNYLKSTGKVSKINLIDILCEYNRSTIIDVLPEEIIAIKRLEIIERLEITDGFDWLWDSWYAFKDISTLDYLEDLRIVKLNFNEIEKINLKVCNNNLFELDFYQNKISDISFLKLFPNLERLNLGVNRIKDIKPLQHLKSLKYLNLSANEIVDISPLKLLTELTEIDLSQNIIEDLGPIYSLTKLRNVSI